MWVQVCSLELKMKQYQLQKLNGAGGEEKKQVHKLDNCSFLIWRRNSVEREPLDWYRLSFWDVLGADIVSALIRAMAVLVRVLFHKLQLAV